VAAPLAGGAGRRARRARAPRARGAHDRRATRTSLHWRASGGRPWSFARARTCTSSSSCRRSSRCAPPGSRRRSGPTRSHRMHPSTCSPRRERSQDRFPGVPARELLQMATWNGARALGRADLGRIARGARPGLAAVEEGPVERPLRVPPLPHARTASLDRSSRRRQAPSVMSLIARLRTYGSLVALIAHGLRAAVCGVRGRPRARRRPAHAAHSGRMLAMIVCMVAARSSAMAYNRYADRDVDAKNPRTRARHIPAGLVSPREASCSTGVSARRLRRFRDDPRARFRRSFPLSSSQCCSATRCRSASPGHRTRGSALRSRSPRAGRGSPPERRRTRRSSLFMGAVRHVALGFRRPLLLAGRALRQRPRSSLDPGPLRDPTAPSSLSTAAHVATAALLASGRTPPPPRAPLRSRRCADGRAPRLRARARRQGETSARSTRPSSTSTRG
jgi:hypothetical protein